MCQHYFSIFETANYTDHADNEMSKTNVRAFFRLPLLLVLDEVQRPANHANRRENLTERKSFALISHLRVIRGEKRLHYG